MTKNPFNFIKHIQIKLNPPHINTSIAQTQNIIMEKNINKRIETYTTGFKDAIREKMASLDFAEKQKINEILEFIYDYDRLCLNKDDFVKRKRTKNCIPSENRCTAKRANGEQCTRQRKENCEFCGTHSKGVPHGSMAANADNPSQQKLEVFAEEIRGIVYYIDKYNNVYKTEDILANKQNPEIIAKCTKNATGYDLHDFVY